LIKEENKMSNAKIECFCHPEEFILLISRRNFADNEILRKITFERNLRKTSVFAFYRTLKRRKK